MKKYAFLIAAVFLISFVSITQSDDSSLEAARAANDLSFETAAAALPITLKGKAAGLRCDSRLRWRSGGYHGRCPYGRIVTGVQVVDNGVAVLECAEVDVTCR